MAKHTFQNPLNREGEIIVASVNDRLDAISRMEEGSFTSFLVQDNGMLKSIIFNLAKREIPFVKINYGAGVFRIVPEERMVKDG